MRIRHGKLLLRNSGDDDDDNDELNRVRLLALRLHVRCAQLYLHNPVRMNKFIYVKLCIQDIKSNHF